MALTHLITLFKQTPLYAVTVTKCCVFEGKAERKDTRQDDTLGLISESTIPEYQVQMEKITVVHQDPLKHTQ